MPRLIYVAITSLDGYVADERGQFAWAAPDAEVLAAVNDIERPIGTHLYGRRMYEVMAPWETAHTLPDQPAFIPGSEAPERDFAAIWRAADKIVFSRSLQAPSTARTRIERDLDAEAVRRLKASAERDLTVGGPELAGQMVKADLVDEYHQFLHPIIVGGGKHWLPQGAVVKLELLAERRFASGVVHVHHRAKRGIC